MKPILQAMLVADHVYEDKATGKKVIAGVFHRLLAQRVSPEKERSADTEEQPAAESDLSEKHPGEDTDTQRVIPLRQVQRAGSPFVYISLTEIQSVAALKLQCVDLLDGQVMFSTELNARASGPLDTIELVVPLPALPAGRGNHLAIELLHEGDVLGSVRIAIDRRS